MADTSLVVREYHTQTQDCLHLIDEQQENASCVATTTRAIASPNPIIQSGSLIFKPVASDSKTVYEVFCGLNYLGLVAKNGDRWINSNCNDDTTDYPTPFESAANLLNPPSPSLQDVVANADKEDSAIQDRTERSLDIEVLERHTGNRYVVRNCTNNNHYVVRPNHENPRHRCECGDANFRGVKCKHQIAVESQMPLRQIKKARELAVGDKIVHLGETLKVCELHPYRYQGQIGSSELHGVRFALQLMPADFAPKVVSMENYQEYYQNAIDEYDREKKVSRWFYPVGEAEFEVA